MTINCAMHIVGKAPSPVPNGSVRSERQVLIWKHCHALSKSMQHASEVSKSRCCCSSYPAVQNVFFSHVTIDSVLFILYVAFHSQPFNTSAVQLHLFKNFLQPFCCSTSSVQKFFSAVLPFDLIRSKNFSSCSAVHIIHFEQLVYPFACRVFSRLHGYRNERFCVRGHIS